MDAEDASNQPVVAIGLYIAAASGVLLLMGLHHLVAGARKQMWWFPCGSFLSMNAGTLSVLAVAVKLPNDLTTPMAGAVDQLAKLSGSVLVVTAMAAAMPSLGSMKHGELCSNMAALALLAFTLLVNVCIQIRTGVISPSFATAHIVVLACAGLLLLLLLTLAIAVPSIASDVRDTLHNRRKHKTLTHRTLSSVSSSTHLPHSVPSTEPHWEALREQAQVQWITYLTADLQFIVARTPVAASAGILASVSALALASAIARSRALAHSPFNEETSVYRWTTFPILVLQLATVLVFLCTSMIRAWKAILFSAPTFRSFTVPLEPFWQQSMVDFKFKPVPISPTDPKRRRIRRLAQIWKEKLCNCFMWVEGLFVQVNRGFCVAFSWVYLLQRIVVLPSKARLHDKKASHSIDRLQEAMVCLYGENPQRLWETSKHLAQVNMAIEKGNEKEISKLAKFLKSRCEVNVDFSNGVRQALGGSKENGIEDAEILSWSLTIATLLAVMTALEWETTGACNASQEAMDAFTEALDMVALVDKHFSAPKKPWEGAARLVWANLESRSKWLHVDLTNTSRHSNGSAILLLEKSAQSIIQPSLGNGSPVSSSEHVAARILLRVINSLKQLERLHQQVDPIGTIVTDVIGACMTSFPMAVQYEIHKVSHKSQLEQLQSGFYFLGKGLHLWDILDWTRPLMVSPLQGSVQGWIEQV